MSKGEPTKSSSETSDSELMTELLQRLTRRFYDGSSYRFPAELSMDKIARCIQLMQHLEWLRYEKLFLSAVEKSSLWPR